MRKILLMGSTGCGKTTLAQALAGDKIVRQKTQYVRREGFIIDTPGEYTETKQMSSALTLYSYEADVVGLLIAATESFSLYSPGITSMVNREVIGIVTRIHDPQANVQQAARWLHLAGCKEVFFVDSVMGEGIADLKMHLEQKNPL